MKKSKKKQYPHKTGIHERIKSLDSIKELYKKNPSKGRSELYHHLERYPEDTYARFFYGQISEKEGDFTSAEEAYRIVAESTAPNRFGGIFGLGEIARKKDNIPLAKKYYRQAIEESPKEQTSAIYTLARLEKIEGNYEEALRILSLSKYASSELKLEKVKILIAQGKTEEAMSLAATIIPSTETERRDLDLIRARTAFANKDYTKASYYFLCAKENAPKDFLYYRTLFEEARMFFEMGEFQATIDNCEEIYRTGEQLYGNINYLLGRAQEALGKYYGALINYRLATEAIGIPNDNLALSYFSLGVLEFAMGDFRKAEQDLKKNLEINKKMQNSVINSGVFALISIYINEGRYQEATSLIREARTFSSEGTDIEQLDLAELLIAKKMNKPIKHQKRTYRERQIISYNKEAALEHIKSHHQGNDPTASKFSAQINIRELYEMIQLQMTEDNRVYTDIMDKYFIDYPNVGYSADGRILNRIGVVVIPGTKDIITMYPDSEEAALRRGDILKTMPEQKVKTSGSRIDRFNSKFAKYQPKN